VNESPPEPADPADDPHRHERELAYRLECKLCQLLAGLVHQLIPPGTLGAGMSVRQTMDTRREFDPETGVITLSPNLVIEVYRKEPRGG
jgi:hypothetical protein